MDWVMDHWAEIALVVAVAKNIYDEVKKKGLWETVIFFAQKIEGAEKKAGPVKRAIAEGIDILSGSAQKNVEGAVSVVDEKKETPRPILRALGGLARKRLGL